MAYVAISGKFMDAVENIISQMQHKEQKSLGSFTYTISGQLPCFKEHAWRGHTELMDALPTKWCTELQNVRLRFDVPDESGSKTVEIQADFSPVLYAPPKYEPYYPRFPVPGDLPEFAPLRERYLRDAEVTARWAKVRTQVREFLNKCRSVNEALKLWPQIEMYLPPDAVKKVNEKTERAVRDKNAAVEALKALDTDHLTSSAVIARMSGV